MSPTMIRVLKSIVLLPACAGAGWVAIWAPWHFARLADEGISADPVEGIQLASFSLFLLVGLVAGYVERHGWWLWGLATLAVPPIRLVMDRRADSSTHEHWMGEMMQFAMFAAFSLFGAWVGAQIRRRQGARRRRRESAERQIEEELAE